MSAGGGATQHQGESRANQPRHRSFSAGPNGPGFSGPTARRIVAEIVPAPEIIELRRRFEGSKVRGPDHYGRYWIWMLTFASTRWPFSMVGRNVHCVTASSALSVNSMGGS